MDDGELVAAYLGVIRHELHVERGKDALDALEARLSPATAPSRSPQRAPGIARLHRALKRMRLHRVPETPLEQLTDDLRFLLLFGVEEPLLDRDAMDLLLADITRDQPSSSRRAAAGGKVVPLRPGREKKR